MGAGRGLQAWQARRGNHIITCPASPVAGIDPRLSQEPSECLAVELYIQSCLYVLRLTKIPRLVLNLE